MALPQVLGRFKDRSTTEYNEEFNGAIYVAIEALNHELRRSKVSVELITLTSQGRWRKGFFCNSLSDSSVEVDLSFIDASDFSGLDSVLLDEVIKVLLEGIDFATSIPLDNSHQKPFYQQLRLH